MDLTELDRYRFSCLPGCGFCCTTSPSVREGEELARVSANPRSGPLVFERDDGRLALKLATRADGKPGAACGCLDGARACGIYEDRPVACRLFPFHVHLGRRAQVSLNLGCPGLWADRRALVPNAAPAIDLRALAEKVVAPALAAADGVEEARKARENYVEFDRRMRELAWPSDQQAFARAFAPTLSHYLDHEGLARIYAGLARGDLDPRHARELPLSAAEEHLPDLLEEVALEAFAADGHTLPQRVDRSMQWMAYRAREGAGIERVLIAGSGNARVEKAAANVEDLLLPWTEEALAEGEQYLALLTRRDHAWGAAAALTDKLAYEVTLASAFGRVLADVSAMILLHAGLAAAARGADEVSAEDARDGVAAADMAFLGLPTLGAVL